MIIAKHANQRILDGCAVFSLISDVMHNHPMFASLTFRGKASDGYAASWTTGSNTPTGHRSRGSSCGRWAGRGGRGCGHRDVLSSDGAAVLAELSSALSSSYRLPLRARRSRLRSRHPENGC